MKWIKRKFRRFKFKLVSLYEFIQLWRSDYWWDVGYLEKLIIWKLKQMGVNFWYNGHTVTSKQKARKMIKAYQLLNQIDKVGEELDKEHEEMFPNIPKKFAEEGLGYSNEYIEYLKTEEGKREKAHFTEIFFRETQLQIELRKEAYKIIAEESYDWVD